MKAFDAACGYLHKQTRSLLIKIANEKKQKTMEIVLRADSPLYIVCTDGTYFITQQGKCADDHKIDAYIVSCHEVREALLRACGYSVYAHRHELTNGYISLGNGSRMAVTGALGNMHGAPADLSSVVGVRVRIGRHIKLKTDFVFDSDKLCSVLIAGPPACGKTTLLRSIAENLADGSYGKYYRVSVVDERNEIFPDGMLASVCADILSGIRKAAGINTALRLCSPQVIICDEIGTTAEADMILDSMNSGIKFICSMHATDMEELLRRECFKRLNEKKVFDRFVFLDNREMPGKIAAILEKTEGLPCVI